MSEESSFINSQNNEDNSLLKQEKEKKRVEEMESMLNKRRSDCGNLQKIFKRVLGRMFGTCRKEEIQNQEVFFRLY